VRQVEGSARTREPGASFLFCWGYIYDKEAQSLAADFAATPGVPEVPIYELPPAIVVHAGPGTLATGFFATRA